VPGAQHLLSKCLEWQSDKKKKMCSALLDKSQALLFSEEVREVLGSERDARRKEGVTASANSEEMLGGPLCQVSLPFFD
jgi:hypothetical protein